ncbi:hypothetical protein LshimejAT787_0404090 [Lyophyllum shimeji]|uniref:Uncharacterized protein n=1 Tax=Lyophyllum shimeji TaxID=47721 RepID=A0A9P3UL75_LYOSH|nr:hypothetical protein LshimejAT787_0404090 [Lyophyllum shimeji]
MLFTTFASTFLVLPSLLNVIASPAPAPQPAPEPAPIPPELGPIIAAKNNLAGTAMYSDDPRFSSTKSYSNAAMTSQVPLSYISVASITAGTLLVAFI